MGDRQCTARSKQSGERCKRAPIPGGTVCVMHGGKSPVVAAAAARRQEEEGARRQAARLGLSRDVAPGEALLEEVRRCAGLVDFFEQRVVELHETDEAVEGQRSALVWGVTEETDTSGGPMAGTATKSEAAPSVWYVLWTQERDRLVKASTAALKAGVEERRVRLAEQQGALVAAVIRRVLERLGLSVEQQALVGTVVPEELRALAAGAAQ